MIPCLPTQKSNTAGRSPKSLSKQLSGVSAYFERLGFSAPVFPCPLASLCFAVIWFPLAPQTLSERPLSSWAPICDSHEAAAWPSSCLSALRQKPLISWLFFFFACNFTACPLKLLSLWLSPGNNYSAFVISILSCLSHAEDTPLPAIGVFYLFITGRDASVYIPFSVSCSESVW